MDVLLTLDLNSLQEEETVPLKLKKELLLDFILYIYSYLNNIILNIYIQYTLFTILSKKKNIELVKIIIK